MPFRSTSPVSSRLAISSRSASTDRQYHDQPLSAYAAETDYFKDGKYARCGASGALYRVRSVDCMWIMVKTVTPRDRQDEGFETNSLTRPLSRIHIDSYDEMVPEQAPPRLEVRRPRESRRSSSRTSSRSSSNRSYRLSRLSWY